MSYQLAQGIRQYVCRDSFVGFQELLVGPESPKHHVANNQQRPAVAQDLHRSIQRTPGPPLWTRLLLRHIPTLAYFNLHFASKIGRLTFPGPRFSVATSIWRTELNQPTIQKS